jgi:hypothetical protein
MVRTRQQQFQKRYFVKALNEDEFVFHNLLSEQKEETYEELQSEEIWLCEERKKYVEIKAKACFLSPEHKAIQEQAEGALLRIRSMTLREVNLPLFKCELAMFSMHAVSRLHSVMQQCLVKSKKRLELGMLMPETWCLFIHQLEKTCLFTHTRRSQKKYIQDKLLNMPLDIVRFRGQKFPSFAYKYWWRLLYKRDTLWIMAEISRLALTYDPHSHIVTADGAVRVDATITCL